MNTIYNSADMHRALTGPVDPALKAILLDRLALLAEYLVDYCLSSLATFVIVEPGDSIQAIERELTFSPMVDFDGYRYPDERFTSGMWEFCIARKGYFDLTFALCDSGLANCLLVPDRDDIEPTLLELCRLYATP